MGNAAPCAGRFTLRSGCGGGQSDSACDDQTAKAGSGRGAPDRRSQPTGRCGGLTTVEVPNSPGIRCGDWSARGVSQRIPQEFADRPGSQQSRVAPSHRRATSVNHRRACSGWRGREKPGGVRGEVGAASHHTTAPAGQRPVRRHRTASHSGSEALGKAGREQARRDAPRAGRLLPYSPFCRAMSP